MALNVMRRDNTKAHYGEIQTRRVEGRLPYKTPRTILKCDCPESCRPNPPDSFQQALLSINGPLISEAQDRVEQSHGRQTSDDLGGAKVMTTKGCR